MKPAHTRSRPRPGPRAAAPGTPTFASVDVVRAPGIAAFVRRHPKLGQRGALGALASGVALFVVACVTTPLAAANIASAQQTPSVPPAEPLITNLSIDPAAPAVQKVLKRDPTHVKRQAPDSHGVISGLAANGIPKVALNAYRVAAARMGNVDPGCGIDWALLAGIGREESDHGRFAGAVLHADGVSTPAIIGPALDGVHWDFIPAPANGLALDGDAKYAHALGPMQFIPSTWAIYGTDANGDHRADIFNINDAALAAARYLCAAGGDLRTHAGRVQGVLAYNHSDQYLAQVLALASAYRRGIPISGIPVGITSGPLPTITDTGYIPPANPGAPTAVHKGSTAGATPSPTPTASASKSTRSPSGAASSSGTKSSSATPTAPKSSSTPTPTTSGSTSPVASPSPSGTCGLLPHLTGQC